MVTSQKVQTFRTENYTEFNNRLQSDWTLATRVIDEEGYFEQEKVLRENMESVADIDNSYLDVSNELELKKTKLNQVKWGTEKYNTLQSEIETLEAKLTNIEANKIAAMNAIQEKVDKVKVPTIIERNYAVLSFEPGYELAIINEPPKYYPVKNSNIFSIYKKFNFISTEYIGRKQVSLDEGSELYKANDYKGWQKTENKYEMVHCFAGIVTTIYKWRPKFRVKSVRFSLGSTQRLALIYPLLIEKYDMYDEFVKLILENPDAYKVVDIVGMELVTEIYDDPNFTGELKLQSKSVMSNAADSVIITSIKDDQYVIEPTGSNVEFSFYEIDKEGDKIASNQRTALHKRFISCKAKNKIKFSYTNEETEAATEDFDSIQDYSTFAKKIFLDTINTKAEIKVYGKFWSIDRLAIKEILDYGYTMYGVTSETPPSVPVKYNFTPRKYDIKIN